MTSQRLGLPCCVGLLIAFATPSLAQPTANTTGGGVAARPEEAFASEMTIEDLEKLVGGRTTMKLKLENATPYEIAAEIERQTGVKVQVDESMAKVNTGFSVETQGELFWHAQCRWQRDLQRKYVRQIIEEKKYAPAPLLGIRKRSGSDSLKIFLRQAVPDYAPVDVWPFVLGVGRIERNQGAWMRDSPEEIAWTDTLELSTEAFIEPKLRIASHEIGCEILEAVDDKGNDLRRDTATNNAVSSLVPEYQPTGFKIGLRPRPDMGKKLAKLRGEFRFTVLTKSEAWEITDLQGTNVSRSFRIGNSVANFFFDGGAKEGNDWVYRLRSSADGREALNSMQRRAGSWDPRFRSALSLDAISPNKENAIGWVFMDGGGALGSDVHLTDANGEIFEVASIGNEGSFKNEKGEVIPSPPSLKVKANYWENYKITFRSHGINVPGASSSSSTSGQASNGTIGNPVKLVVNVPLEWREVRVPFEFSDLPLPPS